MDTERVYTDPLPVFDPFIISNIRLQSGCIFWQPADFSANSDGVIQPSAKWGTYLVIVYAPGLNFAPDIFQRHEPVFIQAFLPQPAVERLPRRIVRWGSRA